MLLTLLAGEKFANVVTAETGAAARSNTAPPPKTANLFIALSHSYMDVEVPWKPVCPARSECDPVAQARR